MYIYIRWLYFKLLFIVFSTPVSWAQEPLQLESVISLTRLVWFMNSSFKRILSN